MGGFGLDLGINLFACMFERRRCLKSAPERGGWKKKGHLTSQTQRHIRVHTGANTAWSARQTHGCPAS